MGSVPRRIAGAVGFAVLFTFFFRFGSGLQDGVEVRSVVTTFVISAIVGYLAWPGIEYAWTNREVGNDRNRLALIGIGLLAGLGISFGLPLWGGQDSGITAFAVLVVLMAALSIAVWVQTRRARGS